MERSDQTGVLARASILAPPGIQIPGRRRIDIVLRPTSDGRFRWFRADGTPTVVDGPTVEQAEHVAKMVWREFELLIAPTPANAP